MNGVQINRSKDLSTIFVPLPRSQWQQIEGSCLCTFCKAHPDLVPYWDTLAVSAKPIEGRVDTAWTVHMPEIHASRYSDG